MAIDLVKITDYARSLLDAHGDKAEAEAAQRAAAAEQAGETGNAEQWHQVRKAINQLRSGHVS